MFLCLYSFASLRARGGRANTLLLPLSNVMSSTYMQIYFNFRIQKVNCADDSWNGHHLIYIFNTSLWRFRIHANCFQLFRVIRDSEFRADRQLLSVEKGSL